MGLHKEPFCFAEKRNVLNFCYILFSFQDISDEFFAEYLQDIS